MEQTTSLASRQSVLSLAQLSFLLAIITFAPLLGNQYITGTIVNAALLVSVIVLGFRKTLFLCFLPSIISLASGLLSAVLAPMIPFIIAGNILLVYVFNLLRKKNYWLGLVPAALLKFSLLFFMSNVLIGLFIKGQVASNIAVMMSWPQLITAVSGGIIAYFIVRGLGLTNKNLVKSA